MSVISHTTILVALFSHPLYSENPEAQRNEVMWPRPNSKRMVEQGERYQAMLNGN